MRRRVQITVQQPHKVIQRKYENENETELSKLLRRLKDEGNEFTISWGIGVCASPYSTISELKQTTMLE